MKLRVEVAIEDDSGQTTKRVVVMEKLCDFEKAIPIGLGMTLADGKDLLQAVQGAYIEAQVESISQDHSHCVKCKEPLKRKDATQMPYRTVFGKFMLTNERLSTCGCDDQTKQSFSPLSGALESHAHPELDYLQVKWASLIPYGQSLQLLEDVLPIEGAISLTGMKEKMLEIGQRIEEAYGSPKDAAEMPGCTMAEVDETTKDEEKRSLVMVVDAGRIRSNATTKEDGPRWFGAMAAKTLGSDSRCHAYVQKLVDCDGARLTEFIEQQEDLSNVALTIITDGGGDVKAASRLPGESHLKILDWFHLAMYFQIVLQTATRLKRWLYNETRTVFEEIVNIKWKFWNGQHKAGLERLRLLAIWIGLKADTKIKETLSSRLFDLGHYLEDNAAHLVNYAQRYRDGLPISSATAEAVVNQVISHRFVKKQQMRWTPEGAHALLQVRTAVLNGELSVYFNRWYPGFAANEAAYSMAA